MTTKLNPLLKIWKDCLNICIDGIFKFNAEANIETLGTSYDNYISELKEIKTILNKNAEKLVDTTILDILDLYENIHNFLKKNIYLYLNDKIINYLKSQKLRSFSYSNNIENTSLHVNMYILKSDNIYIEIQELIFSEFITLGSDIVFKDIINRGSLSLRIYLNNIIKKNMNLSRRQKYILLNITNTDNNNIIAETVVDTIAETVAETVARRPLKKVAINNIQLIHYPIKPIYDSNPELNITSEINSLKISIPNATHFTKYDIDPLINKKYKDLGNIISPLSEKLVNRLKTIVNIQLDTFVATPKDLPNATTIVTEAALYNISNGYKLSPAVIHLPWQKFTEKGNTSFKYYPFGGINLYNKKINDTIEPIILNNIKSDQLLLNKLKDKFMAAVKNETFQPVMYSAELLSVELIKQFKIRFSELIEFFEKNKIELTYILFFNFIFGNEYSNNIFIAKALSIIHVNEYNKFILSAQIENPSLNIKKLEKELIINQKLTLDANGLDLWNYIKNLFIKSDIFERDKLLSIDEKYSNIKFLFKTIINKAVEEKNTLECIPNSIKIYSIIHSF